MKSAYSIEDVEGIDRLLDALLISREKISKAQASINLAFSHFSDAMDAISGFAELQDAYSRIEEISDSLEAVNVAANELESQM